MRLATGLMVALAAVLSGACSQAPPCRSVDAPDSAPSAGCLVLAHGRVLVVEDARGRVSPPGGKTRPWESAQCAAHRESWEETGLNLQPGPLLHTFATGFKLYQCGLYPASGVITTRAPTEVVRAYWLPLAEFGSVSWRFPGQDEQLHALLLELQRQQQGERATAR